MSTKPSSLAVPLKMPAPERLRRRQVIAQTSARQMRMDGQQYVQFSSNDYLGLAQHPKVVQAFQQGVNDYGCSSASSPLITGYQGPHGALVARLKEWLGRDDVLLFSSGFAANSGILKLLAEIYPRIYLDKLSHASLLDGVRASRVWQRFKHQDFVDLQRLFKQNEGQAPAQLVVTEGVFSMDGDQTDAKALSRLLQDTAAPTDLFVDDAHAIGVLGPAGEGIGGQLTQSQVPLLTGTFGKALGGAGAFFAGPADVVDYLVQYCREYMYSTAFPAAQAAAISAAIDICRGDEGVALRARLQHNIQYFRHAAKQAGLDILASTTPIQGVILGAEERALTVSQGLRNANVWCHAIRPPTVPANLSRLRITLSAVHLQQDIDQLIGALQQHAQ